MSALVVTHDAGGVGVVIRATHMCMSLRGVKHGGLMTTTALRGALLREAPARDEFLRVVYQGGTSQ
jgi:GTP cyclohydrolase I